MKNEVERRIDRASEIYYEPKLLCFEVESSSSSDSLPYYFRMKAVDNMKYLGLFMNVNYIIVNYTLIISYFPD